ncbi:hypothetical protein [Mesonia sp.]|uniref:hypothetical protein n=1 Tax=Mesonia sp. TaxID=1960830 RepID=UPI000C8A534C|nr:hypothetical protein [Mesonia sp.]MAN25770.1 hypothetical protein [Mesonia sp.]|tara:strand:- start:120 stop:608 length:489 start_codon:yes stop_codon:yes gene_type:complete
MEYEKKIDLRSDVIQEVIGKTPSWLIKRGLSCFFFIMLIGILISWTIKYPEIIEGELTIIKMNSKQVVEFQGIMKVKQLNLSKVRLNQKALIKLESYPYQEFGTLNGKVASVGDVANKDESFDVSIVFFNDQNFNLKEGYVGNGQIIVEEKRLLNQIFYKYF